MEIEQENVDKGEQEIKRLRQTSKDIITKKQIKNQNKEI